MIRIADQDIEKLLFTERQIAAKVEELGFALTEAYRDKRPLCVCVLRGAAFFYTDLCRQMDCPMDMDFINVTSYVGAQSSGTIKMVRDLVFDVKDRDVLIVEDIVDTGLTLHYLKNLFYSRGAKTVKTVAFLDKVDCHIPEYDTDYRGFNIPNLFLVGYGLDYEDNYRNLPYIGVLRKECY